MSCYLDNLFLRVSQQFSSGKEKEWKGDKGYHFQQTPLSSPVPTRLCQECDLKTPKDIDVVCKLLSGEEHLWDFSLCCLCEQERLQRRSQGGIWALTKMMRLIQEWPTCYINLPRSTVIHQLQPIKCSVVCHVTIRLKCSWFILFVIFWKMSQRNKPTGPNCLDKVFLAYTNVSNPVYLLLVRRRSLFIFLINRRVPQGFVIKPGDRCFMRGRRTGNQSVVHFAENQFMM